MGGRLALGDSTDQLIEDRAAQGSVPANRIEHLKASWSIHAVPSVHALFELNNSDTTGKRRAHLAHWPHVPALAPETTLEFQRSIVDCKPASTKPAWQSSVKKTGGAIPITGNHEWDVVGKQKSPYFIRVEDEPVLFTALDCRWHNAGSAIDYGWPQTHCILTRPSVSPVLALHVRIPVTRPKELDEHWTHASVNSDPKLSDGVVTAPTSFTQELTSLRRRTCGKQARPITAS